MLIFKPLSKTDLPLKVKWLNNKKANVFVLDKIGEETTMEKEEKWFENYQRDENKVFFTIIFNNKPIGFMGLTKDSKNNGEASLFIMIGEDDFRGKGFGNKSLTYLVNYAFQNLNLNRLTAGINKKNIASIQLGKALGFEIISENEEELSFALNR